MTTVENVTERLAAASVQHNDKKEKFGMQDLAKKYERNTNGTKVLVDTNIRKITLKPNQPIYKYAVQVMYDYKKPDGTIVKIEVSKSTKSGTEHDNDKIRCQKVYQKAIEKFSELRKDGPFFYDRQASLYSLSLIPKETLSFSVTEGISKRPNFVRAEFTLSKVEDSFQSTTNDISKTVNSAPSRADRTLIEAMNIMVSAPAFDNQNVITLGACVHYLIDPTGIDVPFKDYQEGGKYSGVGASKAVKTLQGTAKTPSLYMTTEMKTTLFHPDYAELYELLSSYRGFSDNLKANSPAGKRLAKAFIGLDVLCNYGAHKNLKEDGLVMTIRGFGDSSDDTRFDFENKNVSVTQYFKQKYGVTLKHPKLFTIQAKGKHGKIFLPAEVLILCPNQTVTNDQMINNEQADMIKISAAPPHLRKRTTENVVRSVGLASNNMGGLIKVDEPAKIEGIVLEKPKIVFKGNRVADLNNPKAKFPTDFNKAGAYFYPKNIQNWEIAYAQGEEVRGFGDQLLTEMRNNGMNANPPTISYIVQGDLEPVFKKAKAAKKELLFFVVKARYNWHQEIKALEQKYDLLTQEVKAETAEKVFRQPQTRLNIVNKTNMKLGGLNYLIDTEAFKNPRLLIVGFETSGRGSPGEAICVGFAANMLDHHQKFAGGYVYVKQDKDIYGSIIRSTLAQVFKVMKEQRKVPSGPNSPTDIIVYFNGVTEGQFGLLNEKYLAEIRAACSDINAAFRPNITIVASSKTHNERLYKSDQGRIGNLEPGTVVDHTIVSPVYNEWYHASAAARQGTTKTTKFTLIHTSDASMSMAKIENLTNDLCYDHQIVFHPVGLPVPLFIAGRYSQRGAMVLNYHGPAHDQTGEIDFEATNKKLGYGEKQLFKTRFNA